GQSSRFEARRRVQHQLPRATVSNQSDDIAIVGMACMFPGAPDLATFRHNLESGFDAITQVPAKRWDPVFYDPDSDAPDRFYCRRGGFIDEFASFDALGFGIMPIAAQGAEPDQLLALEVAAKALEDAGYKDRAFARDKAAVVLGRGNYIGAGMTRLEQHVRTAQQLVSALKTLVPGIQPAQLEAVKKEFQGQLGGYGPDTAIGLVPNLTASRIANRLDLHGPAFTVDGACASALLATDLAVKELVSGRADIALAGGVHLSHDVAFWSVFCQLGALSRSEQIRPFDKNADGLLIGEGLGIVVLKRLADAERDDDRIYAVIRGTGVSSDGREASIMQPRVDGQLLALDRAWSAAKADPSQVGFIEAHGTATPVGDDAEIRTLARFFGPADGPRAGLGSVKSMIGHTMPAAGIAGLIKAALGVHSRQLLPSLHCDEPNPLIAESRFRVVRESEPWDTDGPLLAGVNAFGFGGINAHVVLQSHGQPKVTRRSRIDRGERAEEILRLGADSLEELITMLDSHQLASGGDGPCRLALVDPTPKRRAKARAAVKKGVTRRGRDGLWFTQKGLVSAGGQVAFMFPGVEAVMDPRISDVARHFDRPVPLDVGATALERQGVGVIAVGRLLHHALDRAGIEPDVICGHSIGEWSGMIASGIIPEAELDAFMETLAPGSLKVPGVVFAAAGASVDRVSALMGGLDGIEISHDNCPRQSICCGPEDQVDVLLERMRDDRILAQKLPFRSGFHSPVFAPYLDAHKAGLEQLRLESGDIPLWSATICEPYPTEPEDIRALALDHLVLPVRFRELTEALYRRGVRVFIQVGTGSLVGFVSDSLRGKDYLAMGANVAQRSGMNQLRRVAAALFVEGMDVELDALSAPQSRPRSALPLQLGVPLVQLKTALEGIRPPPAEPAADPVLAGFDAVMRGVGDAQDAVLKAFEVRRRAENRAPTRAVTKRKLGVAQVPTLIDHSLIPQPPGWTNVSDRNPVVPMTMSIRMMIDAAEALSGLRVIVVGNVRAYKWLVVEPAVEVEIDARQTAPNTIRVQITGFCEATMTMAAHYPPAPAPDPTPLTDPSSPAINASQFYSERWMFHGPAYQAVTRLDSIGADGIRGRLTALPAEGALLDAAGQLFGYWVMASTDHDRLAMPIKIEQLELYGPEPRAGASVDCMVWLRRLGAHDVRADLELVTNGRVWCRITGWDDWRFDTDDRIWPIMHRAENNLYANMEPEGFALLDDPPRSSATRDYLARRFLGQAEREQRANLPEPRQLAWLNGRMAAKDAVRYWLKKNGYGPSFPVEVAIRTAESGQPLVSVHGHPEFDLHCSIAHKDNVAVAAAREGGPVGIDVEKIETRPGSFVSAAFDPRELVLIAAEENRDEWLTRLWSAKEAVGKARGTGLEGRPKALRVEARDGDRLRIGAVWVLTRLYRDYVIAITE
ncbi:MAG: acyl transferase domain-containing protein, partial [Myxococcota bacterium]